MIVLVVLVAVLGAAWVLAGWLESATGRFYHSYASKKFEYPEALLSGSIACPYCKNPVMVSDLIASCVKCGTLHHFDCWKSTGGCSVFGCDGKAESII